MRAVLPKILICDDDPVFQLAVKQSLKSQFDFHSALNADEALVLLSKHAFSSLLLDIQMREPDEGLKLIPRALAIDPDLAIIMCTSLRDFLTVREAMRSGAADYLPKDSEPEELAHAIERVLERRSLLRKREQQNLEVTRSQRHHREMVGESKAMLELRKQVAKFRGSSANVVITGETGTGKEVVARQLRRTLADGTLEPFVAVDSSTIQSSMAESILFGHEKGAFTGAERLVRGIFEEANGGTVYFDEIANMSLEIQAKLLRVLQEKVVTRLGSGKPIELEFRVICATNRDLEALCSAGQFKPDLLQRLNVLPLAVPPLRERSEDVPLLAAHFCAANPRAGTGQMRPIAPRFSPDALQALRNYIWPGNVRELHNLVAYVAVMAESDEIELADLPPKFRDAYRAPAAKSEGESFYDQVMAFERSLLEAQLSKSSGNVSRLAIELGMDRSHLYSKLKQYGLHPRKS